MTNFGPPSDPSIQGMGTSPNPPIGDPILPPNSPHVAGGPAAMAPPPMRAASYPESSQTIMVFVLGLLGLVVCQLLGPSAWHYGKQELEGIDAGRRDPSQRGLAQAGKIMGMVGTILLVLVVVLLLVPMTVFTVTS